MNSIKSRYFRVRLPQTFSNLNWTPLSDNSAFVTDIQLNPPIFASSLRLRVDSWDGGASPPCFRWSPIGCFAGEDSKRTIYKYLIRVIVKYFVKLQRSFPALARSKVGSASATTATTSTTRVCSGRMPEIRARLTEATSSRSTAALRPASSKVCAYVRCTCIPIHATSSLIHI